MVAPGGPHHPYGPCQVPPLWAVAKESTRAPERVHLIQQAHPIGSSGMSTQRTSSAQPHATICHLAIANLGQRGIMHPGASQGCFVQYGTVRYGTVRSGQKHGQPHHHTKHHTRDDALGGRRSTRPAIARQMVRRCRAMRGGGQGQGSDNGSLMFADCPSTLPRPPSTGHRLVVLVLNMIPLALQSATGLY